MNLGSESATIVTGSAGHSGQDRKGEKPHRVANHVELDASQENPQSTGASIALYAPKPYCQNYVRIIPAIQHLRRFRREDPFLK